MVPTIRHSVKSKTMKTVQRSTVARGGAGRQSTEDFQGSENTPHDIIMMDICHTFVQACRMHDTMNGP